MEAQVGNFNFQLEKVKSYDRCFVIALRKNMVDVSSPPLGNFGLKLYFFDTQAFQKNRGHILTIKIDKVAIISARPIRPVS
jgi:hypothetical protein